MRFSRSLKSSSYVLPSPNGTYIATVLSSKLIIRETRSLDILRAVALPADLSSSIQYFLWSPDSSRILLASAETIRVFSPTKSQCIATITNPTSVPAKVTCIAFGATCDEVMVFADFGLKVNIYNLQNSKAVEIPSPKYYTLGTAAKGYSYRAQSPYLALLSRSGGKDIVSIHARPNYQVIRSWIPDTIDAQSIAWNSDGKWLAVCESAGQGHRIHIYTPDGHLYKTWSGPANVSDEDKDISMGAGIRSVEWGPNSDYLAVSDYSLRVSILAIPSFSEALNFMHSFKVHPTGTLRIWHEQVTPSSSCGFERKYILAAQTNCPPTAAPPPSNSSSVAKSGTSIMSFDASGTLLATRSDSMPTTLWIWDIASRTLKAVLVQHAPIVKATWHPVINETILIRCEGDESKGLAHLWEPSWESPKIVDFGLQVAGSKIIGKSIVRWLNSSSAIPALFFSDTQDCILASFAESDEDNLPWQVAVAKGVDVYAQLGGSTLSLVGTDDKANGNGSAVSLLNDDSLTKMSEGSQGPEDTFNFKPQRTSK